MRTLNLRVRSLEELWFCTGTPGKGVCSLDFVWLTGRHGGAVQQLFDDVGDTVAFSSISKSLPQACGGAAGATFSPSVVKLCVLMEC